jgi:arylsulfatase A-like enzyme
MEKIKAEDLELRPNFSERVEAQKMHEQPRFELPEKYNRTRTKYQGHLADPEFLREMYAGYLASTLALDDYMGALLQTLEEEGILENTLVVFTSDHGDHLGSHGIWGKDAPFEESISIPLIIRYPKKVPASTASDVLFTPVDVMPTVLGMAGVDCPEVDGSDLSRVMVNRAPDTRDAALIMGMSHFCNASVINAMDTWRGVRTKKYTYARFEDQTPWLLYDNEVDPYQMNNLAEDPGYAALIADLNGILDQLLREAGDPENTQKLYDKIIRENPKRTMLLDIREVNPGM